MALASRSTVMIKENTVHVIVDPQLLFQRIVLWETVVKNYHHCSSMTYVATRLHCLYPPPFLCRQVRRPLLRSSGSNGELREPSITKSSMATKINPQLKTPHNQTKRGLPKCYSSLYMLNSYLIQERGNFEEYHKQAAVHTLSPWKTRGLDAIHIMQNMMWMFSLFKLMLPLPE